MGGRERGGERERTSECVGKREIEEGGERQKGERGGRMCLKERERLREGRERECVCVRERVRKNVCERGEGGDGGGGGDGKSVCVCVCDRGGNVSESMNCV